MTAPLIVIWPPWAQINPEFATSPLTIRLPVAASVPVGHDICAGVDDQGMETGRDDRAVVDQRHSPELAGAGDGVVHVGERDAREAA